MIVLQNHPVIGLYKHLRRDNFMYFGADKSIGFSISKIWERKGEIIEVIVAGGAVFFLDLLLNITSGAEYLHAHQLILTTVAISLIASIIFAKLNPESAILRLFGLFDKDNINSILKSSGLEGFVRRFYNYPYYAAHIFLVLYSIEYFILPYYSNLIDFNPVDKMYFIISVIASAFFINLLSSIMYKRNIPKYAVWLTLTPLWIVIEWNLINYSDRIIPIISFVVGIPPIVSAYVLLRSISTNHSCKKSRQIQPNNRS